MIQLTRAQITEIIEETKAQLAGKAITPEAVKTRILESHPSLANAVITRNSRTYTAIDYLMSDLDSYL